MGCRCPAPGSLLRPTRKHVDEALLGGASHGTIVIEFLNPMINGPAQQDEQTNEREHIKSFRKKWSHFSAEVTLILRHLFGLFLGLSVPFLPAHVHDMPLVIAK